MARTPADKPILAIYTTTDSEGKERFTIDEPDGYTHAFAPRSFSTADEARAAGEYILGYGRHEAKKLYDEAAASNIRLTDQVSKLKDQAASLVDESRNLAHKIATKRAVVWIVGIIAFSIGMLVGSLVF